MFCITSFCADSFTSVSVALQLAVPRTKFISIKRKLLLTSPHAFPACRPNKRHFHLLYVETWISCVLMNLEHQTPCDNACFVLAIGVHTVSAENGFRHLCFFPRSEKTLVMYLIIHNQYTFFRLSKPAASSSWGVHNNLTLYEKINIT